MLADGIEVGQFITVLSLGALFFLFFSHFRHIIYVSSMSPLLYIAQLIFVLVLILVRRSRKLQYYVTLDSRLE